MIKYNKDDKKLVVPCGLGFKTMEDTFRDGYERGQKDNADFLFNIDYQSIDYDFANEYFERRAVPVSVGGCSTLRSGNFVGRNLDWLYDNEVNVVVRYNGTIGVAGGLKTLNRKTIEEGLDAETKAILPFFLQDGFNGTLYASMNVVPAQGNIQTEGRERVCSIMLVRYILDNYTSVSDAVNGLADKQIFFPKALLDMGYETHYTLADAHDSVVLEVIDGQLQVIESEVNTNFHIYGTTPNKDGSYNTPETAIDGQYASDNNVEEYGTGLERWNILNKYAVGSKDDMFAALDAVKFSRAYTGANWGSEFVGGDITVDTPLNDPEFQKRIAKYEAKYASRSRVNGDVWITVHSSVYDLQNGVLYLKTQENNAENIYIL